MISSGCAPRSSANPFAVFSKASRSQLLVASVMNEPGMMQFTRTFGPNACASATVIALIPALAAE